MCLSTLVPRFVARSQASLCVVIFSYRIYSTCLGSHLPALPNPLSCPLPLPCPALVCLWYVPFVGKMFYLCRLCLRFVHSFLSFCLIDFLGNWCWFFFFLCSTLILTLCSWVAFCLIAKNWLESLRGRNTLNWFQMIRIRVDGTMDMNEMNDKGTITFTWITSEYIVRL